MTTTAEDAATAAEPAAHAAPRPLLEVENLTVARADNPEARIVDGVSFSLAPGEALGIAGESGCGKTTTALSLLGLLPTGLRRTAGAIRLDTGDRIRNLHSISPAGMREVRWASASMVFQGAMNALDPVMRVGRQIREAILTHEPELGRRAADQRVAELLEQVRIPPARARDYPHEFSGGQRQRLMIALALSCRPRLVIADEPTTALDVLTQKQVLELIADLRRELGLSLILITHDLSVLAETCDRVAVMYAGRIVETGSVPEVYRSPQHPYTQRLLGSFPVVGGPRRLPEAIPGVPPDPARPPKPGCSFAPRCHRAAEACGQSAPQLIRIGRAPDTTHQAACRFAPWPTTEETE